MSVTLRAGQRAQIATEEAMRKAEEQIARYSWQDFKAGAIKSMGRDLGGGVVTFHR